MIKYFKNYYQQGKLHCNKIIFAIITGKAYFKVWSFTFKSLTTSLEINYNIFHIIFLFKRLRSMVDKHNYTIRQMFEGINRVYSV